MFVGCWLFWVGPCLLRAVCCVVVDAWALAVACVAFGCRCLFLCVVCVLCIGCGLGIGCLFSFPSLRVGRCWLFICYWSLLVVCGWLLAMCFFFGFRCMLFVCCVLLSACCLLVVYYLVFIVRRVVCSLLLCVLVRVCGSLQCLRCVLIMVRCVLCVVVLSVVSFWFVVC